MNEDQHILVELDHSYKERVPLPSQVVRELFPEVATAPYR